MNAKEPTHGIDGAQPSVNADQTTRAVDPHASHAFGVDAPISADLAGAFRATRFRRRELHAHGGLGEVYVADDLELGRPVALKRIRDGREIRAEDEIRFRREAEITGRLEHPGIVPIYGLGSDSENRPFYAMRFIEGQTLASAIDSFHHAERPDRDPGERTLALRHLLTRFVAACQAVAFAHSRGIIHRDIKPANIMLGNFGETLVVDWGLAKPADASSHPASDNKPPANSQIERSGADANSTWAIADEVPPGSDPSVAAREGIGFTLRKISWLNEMTGNNAEAENNLRRTLELWEKLAADFPAMPSYRGNIADTLSQLGDVLHNLKRPQDAASAFQRAQAVLIDLLKQYPDNNWFRSGLARAYNDEALLEQDAKRWTEAEALLEKSLALRADLMTRLPNDIATANALGGVYVNLGNLEHGRLQYPKALDWYGKAIDVLGAVFTQKPSDTTTRRFLSAAYWDRARSLAALHYHWESLPDWEKALELAPPENKAAIQLGKGISAVLALSPQNKTKDKSP